MPDLQPVKEQLVWIRFGAARAIMMSVAIALRNGVFPLGDAASSSFFIALARYPESVAEPTVRTTEPR